MTDLTPRPDPDQLLEHIQAEEQSIHRGRLKIFLGYAAGVGKTYAMLEAAHQRKKEGMDVVVGLVETHGRVETEAFLEGLTAIPCKVLEFHSIHINEMDVDAILTRHPQLVLVDELAHTNIPNSRHPKRYHDVVELIDAGINVYTTMNIQHLESLNDVIAQITGIRVRETVPDSILDKATEIELVDLPPDELINRLQAGKVYIPDQAARAIRNFFRVGNLTALRELTMRCAAERVDNQMTSYMQTRAIPGPWQAVERLLVCVSPSSFGEHLVRSTRRLADELNAEWQVVYVDTPEHAHLSDKKHSQIDSTLQLAKELGARTAILPLSKTSPSIASSIIEFARKHNFTKIITGKPIRPLWQDILRGSVVDQLIRKSQNIDVYVINTNHSLDHDRWERTLDWRMIPWYRYLLSLVLVTIASGLSRLVGSGISPTNLVMIYLLAVVIAAIYLGRGPAILTSILSVFAFDYFFVPPFFKFTVSDTEYLLTFSGLLTVGLVISYLAVRAQEQAEAARQREIDMSTLYTLSRDLAASRDLQDIIKATLFHINMAFDWESTLFLPDGYGNLSQQGLADEFVDESEVAVAMWAFKQGEPAGRSTNTLPESKLHFIPLKISQRVIGILGVKPHNDSPKLTSGQHRLLQAFASQLALAIERVQLAEQANQAELLKATEKLQTALLNSISHDLRTPLVTITGALSSLQDQNILLSDDEQVSLIDTALQEADRLNRLVGNLLSMIRLESGAMKVISLPGDIEDAVGVALEQLNDRLGERPIKILIPDHFPLIPMDFALIVQVLVNVIDNAIKYSQPGSPIEIEASLDGDSANIAVSDNGIEIPPEDLIKIFDKFYRVHRHDNITGTGLGLAICRGIVESHGGNITAQNRSGEGVAINIQLPLKTKQEAGK